MNVYVFVSDQLSEPNARWAIQWGRALQLAWHEFLQDWHTWNQVPYQKASALSALAGLEQGLELRQSVTERDGLECWVNLFGLQVVAFLVNSLGSRGTQVCFGLAL